MRINRLFIICLFSLFAAAGCSDGKSIGAPNQGQGDGPTAPPGTQPGDPCAEVELRWVAPTQNEDGSELTDLAGYRVYMGFQSRVYADVMELNDPSLVQYLLEGLEYNREYYMAMTAVNANGDESRYSNEVLKLANTCPVFMSFSQPSAHH